MPLDYDDRTDFDNAKSGFTATLDPVTINNDGGRVVFDLAPSAYLDGERPDTVHPSLWRQAQLCRVNGLFEVIDGFYQIRGFDLSNMTLVEGDTGVIAIDPLVSAETAAAGLALYREHRGNRPVTGVIYTHSHGDHFGGVMGVLPAGAGDVPIVASEGFMEHAVSDNVYAGTAMIRRGTYMYGMILNPGPTGQVSTGLGIRGSEGSVGLLAPTVDITHTAQEETIDGVRIVFQSTPGTEAPAELNFHFPDRRALCLAENAVHNLHNVLTLRGALVRDPRIWSHYLNEAVELFATDTDTAFASHHWPTWGTDNIVKFLSEQRDLYAYLHDQTLRRLSKGETGIEIAEDFPLPPALDDAWHARGYYGSVSHNVKAVYQRYLGWFDGHPTSLWQHPPKAAATRYAKAFGGVDALISQGRAFAADGDLRFAAELLKHAVFADPDNADAKTALAEVFTTLGYGAENATWRNFYLGGAKELSGGITPTPLDFGGGMAAALSVEQLFDTIAIRIDGPRAATEPLTIERTFTDLGNHRQNRAVQRCPDPNPRPAYQRRSRPFHHPQQTPTRRRPRRPRTLRNRTPRDPGVLQGLLALLDNPDVGFPIVTP